MVPAKVILLPFLAFLHDGRLGDRLVGWTCCSIPLGPRPEAVRSAAERFQPC